MYWERLPYRGLAKLTGIARVAGLYLGIGANHPRAMYDPGHLGEQKPH